MFILSKTTSNGHRKSLLSKNCSFVCLCGFVVMYYTISDSLSLKKIRCFALLHTHKKFFLSSCVKNRPCMKRWCPFLISSLCMPLLRGQPNKSADNSTGYLSLHCVSCHLWDCERKQVQQQAAFMVNVQVLRCVIAHSAGAESHLSANDHNTFFCFFLSFCF